MSKRCLYLIINNVILVTFCINKNSPRHEKVYMITVNIL